VCSALFLISDDVTQHLNRDDVRHCDTLSDRTVVNRMHIRRPWAMKGIDKNGFLSFGMYLMCQNLLLRVLFLFCNRGVHGESIIGLY
jgi:hypothetical protein